MPYRRRSYFYCARSHAEVVGMCLCDCVRRLSLGHGWLRRLFIAAGVPPRMWAMIHLLFSNMETRFEFQGAVVAAVLVKSGIRQGCPLSGTSFALVPDSFVMCFPAQAIVFRHSFSCADDDAIMVANILRILGMQVDGLCRFASAIRIALIEGPPNAFSRLFGAAAPKSFGHDWTLF